MAPFGSLQSLANRLLTPLGFGPSGAGSRTDRSRTVDRSVEPVPEAPVRVSNVNGDVAVQPADGDEVEVHAVIRPAGRRGSVDDAEVEITRDRDGVSVDVDHDDGGFLSGGGASVALTVRVPEGTPLGSAETVNGSLAVEGGAGDAHLESVNGEVTVRDVDGRLELETVNGSIDADRIRALRFAEATNGSVDVCVAELPGDLTVETTTGSVTIEVPADADPRLELDSTLGSVSVEGLRAGEGTGPAVRAATTTGSITVRGVEE